MNMKSGARNKFPIWLLCIETRTAYGHFKLDERKSNDECILLLLESHKENGELKQEIKKLKAKAENPRCL